jgi:NAD(P)-dependent dehydrogenase (short-subunit alcohol dehydrogenase family)
VLLKDKVILINGVGPGLGRTLAHLAVAEGAQVVLAARTQAYLDGVAAELEAKGGKVLACATDISKAETCQRTADAALAKFGRIDGLVNSAFRSGEKASAAETDPAELLACVDIAAAGTLRMSQAVLPAMKQQGAGSVVNVSSMGTVFAYPNQAAYASAKGAMNTLTRYMAMEWSKFGVRANVARLGWIGGATVERMLDGIAAQQGTTREKLEAGITARIPMGVIPPEEDCAKPILFLLSDYAKMITGSTLEVNSGEFMPL